MGSTCMINGCESPYPDDECQTDPDCQVLNCPSCPSGVSVRPVGLGNNTCNMNLSWQNVFYENGYDIYRDGVYRTTRGVNVASWTDTNVACRASSYQYEVRPYASGCSALSCSQNPGSCPCTLTPTPTTPGPTSTPTSTPTITLTPTPTIAGGAAWFQGQGGDVYGNDISSSVILGEFLSTNLESYSGVVVSGGGINSGDGGVSESDPDWQKTGERITGFRKGIKYDYDYFYEKFGPLNDNYDGGGKPAGGTIDNPAVYYDYPIFSTSVTGSWNVGTGESLVIFINGDLSIETDIEVAEGGFLAFIVNGNLSIDSTVGRPAGASGSCLEGVFIVNGSIETGETTQVATAKLVAEGIFVADADINGSGEFNFQRNLGAANGTTPAEKFIYRPDLLFSAPEQFLKKGLSWEEIVP